MFPSMRVRCSGLLELRLEYCAFAGHLSLEDCQGLKDLRLERVDILGDEGNGMDTALATACGSQELAMFTCGTALMPSAISHMTHLRKLTVLCGLEAVQCALPQSLEYVLLGHWLPEIPQCLELLPNLRDLTLRSFRKAFSVTRPLTPLLMQPLLQDLTLTRLVSIEGDERSATWSPQSQYYIGLAIEDIRRHSLDLTLKV